MNDEYKMTFNDLLYAKEEYDNALEANLKVKNLQTLKDLEIKEKQLLKIGRAYYESRALRLPELLSKFVEENKIRNNVKVKK